MMIIMPAKQMQHVRNSSPEQLAPFRKKPCRSHAEANAMEARGETDLLEIPAYQYAGILYYSMIMLKVVF